MPVFRTFLASAGIVVAFWLPSLPSTAAAQGTGPKPKAAGDAGDVTQDVTGGEVAHARRTFAEALRDEDAHRYAAALEKYKQVQRVKDTPAVRYRIGAALEGLGKFARAVDAYAGAFSLATAQGTDANVAESAKERAQALDARTAHVALRIPPAYADVKVAVDGELVDARNDVRVDPGKHVIEVTASGAHPFRAPLTLSEGGRAELPVNFEPIATSAPTTTIEPTAPTPESRSSPLGTIGIVTAGVGAAVVATGVVVLVIRGGTISDLEAACPNNQCPAARERELSDMRDSALTQGPLGATLVGVGAATLVTGVGLTIWSRAHANTASASVVPVWGGSNGGLLVRGRF